MATPSNHWKLGLFVVIGVVLLLATLVFLGAQSLKHEGVSYKTYFDESVQGLEIGSPVKYRGVTIGNVSLIDIAGDRRHVEVTCDITVSELDRLGLNSAGAGTRGKKARINIPPDLRTQLGSTGITGVKFIQMDFFDPKDFPPPSLPFPIPENYIPAAPSTMKNLEDSVTHALNRFPELADQLVALLGEVNHVLVDIDKRGIPEKAVGTLAQANEVLQRLQVTIAAVNAPKLSEGVQETIEGLNVTVTRLNHLLERIDGDKGLMASAQRASDSVGDLAGAAKGIGGDLQDTLREVRDAVETIQRLGDSLERDSDMLLKGRSAAKKK